MVVGSAVVPWDDVVGAFVDDVVLIVVVRAALVVLVVDEVSVLGAWVDETVEGRTVKHEDEIGVSVP